MKAIKVTIVIFLFSLVILGCISPELRTARISVNEKDWDRAIKSLDIETERNPVNDEAFYLKGLCYEKKSDWVNMSLNYEKSLAISDLFKEKIDKSRKRLVIKYQNSSIINWDIAKSMKAYGEKAGAEAVLARALEYIAVELEGLFNGLINDIEARYGARAAGDVRAEFEKMNVFDPIKLLLENVRAVRDDENAVPLLIGYFIDWSEAFRAGIAAEGYLSEEQLKAMDLNIENLREAKKRAETGWEGGGGFKLLKEITSMTDAFSTETGGEEAAQDVFDLSEYEKMMKIAEEGITDVYEVYYSSLSSLDTAIIIDPHNKSLYVRAAVIANDGGLSDEVIKYSQQAIDLEAEGENDPVMRIIQMQAYILKGNDEEVIKWAKEVMRVIDVEEDDPSLYLQAFDELINVYESQGKEELATQTTQETLAKFPDNLLLKKNLAIFMVRRKDYAAATKIYEDVLKQASDDFDANLTIGTILCNQEKYKDAIPYLVKAHEVDPDNIAAVTNLMSAYYNSDQDVKGGEMRNKLKALTGGE